MYAVLNLSEPYYKEIIINGVDYSCVPANMLFRDGFAFGSKDYIIERRDGKYYRHEGDNVIELPEETIDVFMAHNHMMKIYAKYPNIPFAVEYQDGNVSCSVFPKLADEIMNRMKYKQPFEYLQITQRKNGIIIVNGLFYCGGNMKFQKDADFSRIIGRDGVLHGGPCIIVRKNGEYFYHSSYLNSLIMLIPTGEQLFDCIKYIQDNYRGEDKKFSLYGGEYVEIK
jgi:hypothetical protein